MRLRENSVFLRVTTTTDLLHDGTHLALFDAVSDLLGQPWSTLEDQQMRGRPMLMSDGGAALLTQLQSGGRMQAARIVARMDSGASLELHARNHPYSGIAVTMIDCRLPHAWLVDQDPTGDQSAALFQQLIEVTKPLCAHAHDTDDHTIQNTSSAMTLKLGFGVLVDGDVDLADNPGREFSIGEYRFCANWMAYYGAGSVERLALEDDATWLALDYTADESGGQFTRLYGSPLSAADPAHRALQLSHRDKLGFVGLSDRERWRYGYWKRKP